MGRTTDGDHADAHAYKTLKSRRTAAATATATTIATTAGHQLLDY